MEVEKECDHAGLQQRLDEVAAEVVVTRLSLAVALVTEIEKGFESVILVPIVLWKVGCWGRTIPPSAAPTMMQG